jgi:hypothetical protein
MEAFGALKGAQGLKEFGCLLPSPTRFYVPAST